MPASHQRRFTAAAVGVALVVAAAISCTEPDGPSPPGSGPATTVPTTPGTVPSTKPGTINCGTHHGDSGYPTTLFQQPVLEGGGRCLLDAWQTGTPATFVTWQGDGQGRNLVKTTYLITRARRVEVTTDRSHTSPPGGVLNQVCQTLTAGASGLRVSNCEPVPPGAPPFDGTECGTLPYATGWPTVPPIGLHLQPGVCFLDAWETGTPARLVTRDQTDGNGGAIRIVTYDILGPGELRVTTDPRQTVRPGPVTIEHCSSLGHDGFRLKPGGCVPA